MIIDTSAIVAVILKEPDAEQLLEQLDDADEIGVGAATMVETGLVLVARVGLVGKSLLARFVEEFAIEVVPIDDRHWTVAVDAFVRYGKGRHPAALNFGDCLTYAVARVSNEPLLCKGDDFPQTDLDLVPNRK